MDVDEAPSTVGTSVATTSEAACHGHHQLSGEGEGAKAKDDAVVECDPEFLQSVLQYLPGVDPQNEEMRKAIESLTTGFKSDQGASNETPEKKDNDEGSDVDKDK